MISGRCDECSQDLPLRHFNNGSCRDFRVMSIRDDTVGAAGIAAGRPCARQLADDTSAAIFRQSYNSPRQPTTDLERRSAEHGTTDQQHTAATTSAASAEGAQSQRFPTADTSGYVTEFDAESDTACSNATTSPLFITPDKLLTKKKTSGTDSGYAGR